MAKVGTTGEICWQNLMSPQSLGLYQECPGPCFRASWAGCVVEVLAPSDSSVQGVQCQLPAGKFGRRRQCAQNLDHFGSGPAWARTGAAARRSTVENSSSDLRERLQAFLEENPHPPFDHPDLNMYQLNHRLQSHLAGPALCLSLRYPAKASTERAKSSPSTQNTPLSAHPVAGGECPGLDSHVSTESRINGGIQNTSPSSVVSIKAPAIGSPPPASARSSTEPRSDTRIQRRQRAPTQPQQSLIDHTHGQPDRVPSPASRSKPSLSFRSSAICSRPPDLQVPGYSTAASISRRPTHHHVHSTMSSLSLRPHTCPGLPPPVCRPRPGLRPRPIRRESRTAWRDSGEHHRPQWRPPATVSGSGRSSPTGWNPSSATGPAPVSASFALQTFVLCLTGAYGSWAPLHAQWAPEFSRGAGRGQRAEHRRGPGLRRSVRTQAAMPQPTSGSEPDVVA
ncbi:hypothetical protein PtA15_3A270 [Puccinia triticina]|uniref:Uncharacterized protein n=1 Tax=Puccinia triticina TaxID=208348 RepID=A0ABY7CDR3_9BASI|nr:uncharacterized protein PtA15_3A270 [Puccinia triticina]WAQ82905.1 hypothetical protein PtA15_3A270 [Puccinia triticina]